MTRKEYNDYRYIKSYKTKGFKLTYGTTLTIPVNASKDYKAKLNDLYKSWGFHPASVRVDRQFFDDEMRIIYIYGLTWEMNGEEHSWSELYSKEEHERFNEALIA